jgi:hypothetical protein
MTSRVMIQGREVEADDALHLASEFTRMSYGTSNPILRKALQRSAYHIRTMVAEAACKNHPFEIINPYEQGDTL